MSFDSKDSLYLNYLKFMRLFRGKVSENADFANIVSEKREFTFSVPHLKKSVQTLADSSEVHTLMIPTKLMTDGLEKWKRLGGVTFMSRRERNSEETKTEVTLKCGNDSQIIKDFSAAQCAGFLETPDAQKNWAAWLTQANQKNNDDRDVVFHVAYIDGKPVAGAIELRSHSCIGIYGVATDPAFRKRGLGTLLLNRILRDSNTNDTVGLQVETESYAHCYYRKLGFADTFELARFKNEN